jgi:hypothetical protein
MLSTVIRKKALPDSDSNDAGRKTYYFHHDQSYDKIDKVSNHQVDPQQQEHILAGYTERPTIEQARKLGVQWFHTNIVITTYTMPMFSELYSRLCRYISAIIQDGTKPSNLEDNANIFFSISTQGSKPCHERIHVFNEGSVHLAAEWEKQYRRRRQNETGVQYEIYEADIGWEFYMPLTTEGMVLRVMQAEGNILPIYVPFGHALLLRGDCFRGGSYGSEGSKYLRAVIVPNEIPWKEERHYLISNTDPVVPPWIAGTDAVAAAADTDAFVDVAKEAAKKWEDRWCKTFEANDMMYVAVRPQYIPDQRDKRHAGSYALDKFRTTFCQSFTSREYRRILDDNFGNPKIKTIVRLATLRRLKKKYRGFEYWDNFYPKVPVIQGGDNDEEDDDGADEEQDDDADEEQDDDADEEQDNDADEEEVDADVTNET